MARNTGLSLFKNIQCTHKSYVHELRLGSPHSYYVLLSDRHLEIHFRRYHAMTLKAKVLHREKNFF